jgi:hypothetical protein
MSPAPVPGMSPPTAIRSVDFPPETSMVFAARKLEARIPALESAGNFQSFCTLTMTPKRYLPFS